MSSDIIPVSFLFREIKFAVGPTFFLIHCSILLSIQVSVLTDQVEAQGEKIRDLEFCLEEHREKLNATEEMLQQVTYRSWLQGAIFLLSYLKCYIYV